MFIDVRKIITEYEKDDDNNIVKDPIKGRPIISGRSVVIETLKVSEIKSARPWHKTKSEAEQIKGDITILYMVDKPGSTKTSEIHIEENHAEFSSRLGSIQLVNG